MLPSDVGAAPAASARYPVHSSAPGASVRRDHASSGAADPFGDLVDRYADEPAESPAGHDGAAAGSTRKPVPSTTAPAAEATEPAQNAEAAPRAVRNTRQKAVRGEELDAVATRRRAAADELPVDDLLSFSPVSMPRAVAVTVAEVDATPGAVLAELTASPDAQAAFLATGENAAGIDVPEDAAGRVQAGEPVSAELLAAVRAAQAQRSTEARNVVGTKAAAAAAAMSPADAARHVARAALRHTLSTTTADGTEVATATETTVTEVLPQRVASVAAPAVVGAHDAGERIVGLERAGSRSPLAATPGQVHATGPSPLDVASDASVPSTEEVSDAAVLSADVTSDAEGGVAIGREPRPGMRAAQPQAAPAWLDPVAPHPAALVSEVVASTAAPRKAQPEDPQVPAAPRTTARAAQAIAAFHAASAVGATGTPATTAAQVVSTGSVASALLDSELPTQIIRAMHVQFGNGSGEAQLRLNPGFLGGLTVGVRIEGASVVASLQASNAEVRDWMRTNEPMLRQALADQGLQLERLVIVDEESQTSDNEGRERKGEPQEQPSRRRSRRAADQGTFELVF